MSQNNHQRMLETYKSHTPLEKFLQDGYSFKPGKSSDYISYKEFVEYFVGIKTISKHNLIISINFTYGWMPTIFEFCSNRFDEALEILNNSKNGTIPKINQLIVLKELLNNSLVGTSKLLHFINPEVFAIWDSRVYRYLTGNEPHGYRMIDYGAYLSYLAFCDYITKEPAYEDVHKSIISKVGYSMTKYRTSELIMYSAWGIKR